MQRDFEPFSTAVDVRVIPSGGWQRVIGALLCVFGLFPALAATPLNGAEAAATICFTLGGALLFWGAMLRYLSALEEKLGLLIVSSGASEQTDSMHQAAPRS